MTRIALEVRALSTHGGGVRRYTQEIVRRLLAQKTTYEFHLLYDSARHRGAFSAGEEHVVPVLHPSLWLLWDQISVPLALRRVHADLVHYFKPATTILPLLPRAVATVYDVIPLLFPETQTSAQRWYWRVQLPLVARRCEHLITISECSKRDIVERLQVSPDRVTVTPLGVDDMFSVPSPEAVARMRERLQLPEPYMLFVGTIEPRKNVAGLLHAFAEVASRIPHTFIIAGKWGWKYEDVQEALRDPRLTNRVRMLSFVDPEFLPALYGAADAFVFPSLYEGFGLPPLEAMACGTPVITSTTSSLPEVVGPHALLVNPEDRTELAQAIERMATDETLRHRLRSEGPLWAQRFTWDRAAEQTLGVYAHVLRMTA